MTTLRTRSGLVVDILAVALTLVAGATDVLSFMRLGQVFTSVMTGNLVLLGLAIGTRDGSLMAHTIVALAGYAVGTAGGSWIATRPSRAGGYLWPRAVTVALGIELVLFATVTLGWEAVGSDPRGGAQLLLLLIAAVAMGVQASAVREIRVEGLSTTYFTSTVTEVVTGIVIAGRSFDARSLIQLVGLAAGAGCGALVLVHTPAFAPAFQVGLLAGVVAAAVWRWGVPQPG